MSQPQRARLVVLISGRGSNLQAIARACADGRLAADVVAVIGNRPRAPGLDWAARHGIEVVSLDHRAYASRDAFDADLSEAVACREPDWVVLAGFMRVLGTPFIDRFAGRLVNIHPSLLPLYPGLRTHERALADGMLVHGATVHLVTPDLDHGPIVAQAIVGVRPEDTPASLAARLLPLEHRLYVSALSLLIDGSLLLRAGRIVAGPAAGRGGEHVEGGKDVKGSKGGEERDARGDVRRLLVDPMLVATEPAVFP